MKYVFKRDLSDIAECFIIRSRTKILGRFEQNNSGNTGNAVSFIQKTTVLWKILRFKLFDFRNFYVHTKYMSLYFVIAIVQSLSVSIREFFLGKTFLILTMQCAYALCSQKSKMVTDMALKFQEIFIKGLFFSVLLVKSSSRIMVEIDMKKNDAAPFPPSKLLLKNDEFNVKQYCRSRGYHGMPGARGTIAPPSSRLWQIS